MSTTAIQVALRQIVKLPSLPILPARPNLQGNTWIVPGSSSTRPLWFDGRFLAAVDVKREQDYFLDRQASIAKAAGFGVMHGLLVEQGTTNGAPDTESIVVHAGDGITPSGKLVMIASDLTIQLADIPDEENLNEQFGLSEAAQQPSRTRTGIYVIALRPVEFTANPVSSYPAGLQSPRVTQDGNIVEATAVSLVEYPNPVSSYDPSQQQAALARQIFLSGDAGTLSDSLLPLAMISIDRDAIQWVDPYLVRRDSGPQNSDVQLSLPDPAVQQAYFLQYDARLQAVAAPFLNATPPQKAVFAATDYFQALPPAGRFPMDAIDVYFPPQMNTTFTQIPADELPAVLEDAMSLPAIDLTLPAAAYANISIYTLQAVPRQPAGSGAAATYGFYVRRRSEPVFPSFSTMPPTTTTPGP